MSRQSELPLAFRALAKHVRTALLSIQGTRIYGRLPAFEVAIRETSGGRQLAGKNCFGSLPIHRGPISSFIKGLIHERFERPHLSFV